MAYNYDYRNCNLAARDMEIGTRVKAEFNTKFIPSIYDGAVVRGEEEVCCVIAYETETSMGETNVYIIAAYDWAGSPVELTAEEEKAFVTDIDAVLWDNRD
jgi:hypothetical protein